MSNVTAVTKKVVMTSNRQLVFPAKKSTRYQVWTWNACEACWELMRDDNTWQGAYLASQKCGQSTEIHVLRADEQ